MSLHNFSLPISLLMRHNMHWAICDTRSQKHTILPWAKLYCVYRSLCFIFVNTLPLIILNLLPELNLSIVPASSNNRFIFRMSPSNWPARALMSKICANIRVNQLSGALRNNLVSLHPANLDYSIAICSSQSSSKEIKLWVILSRDH